MPKITLNDRIFIAGASGMAGNAIKKTLLKKGYGSKNGSGLLFTPTRKKLNLLDNNEVKNWFQISKPNVVIIAAAKVGGIQSNAMHPADFLLENLRIQNNIIENAWLNGVKRLLFLGSSCIYPKFATQPIVEEDLLNGYLEQTTESYAIAKIAGIKLCESLRRQYGFDAISLMPTNLYGPGDNYNLEQSHVMAALIRKFVEASQKDLPEVTCWGSGSPFREFMHTEDLGDAVVFALENWDLENKDAPYFKDGKSPLSYLNVGTGKDISIKSLAELIAQIAGFKGKIIWDKTKPDGTPKKLLDISRIRELGWRSKINLKEGIIKTIFSFKDEVQKGIVRV